MMYESEVKLILTQLKEEEEKETFDSFYKTLKKEFKKELKTTRKGHKGDEQIHTEEQLEKHFEEMKASLKKKYMTAANHFYKKRLKEGENLVRKGEHKAEEFLQKGHYRDGLDAEEEREKKGAKGIVWVLAVCAFVGLGYYAVKVYRARKNENEYIVRGEPVNYDNISFQ